MASIKVRLSMLTSRKKKNILISALVVVITAIVGYALVNSRAAGFFVSVNPVNATLSGNAQLVNNAGSSDKVLQFGDGLSVPPQAGGLNLPRVPWEGGPAFYENFPQAKASGWTDPSFFPVGIWGATVETQRDIDTDKEVGINTYLELYGNPNFPLIRNNGMFAIHGITNGSGIGNETVGWFLSDEPEQFGQGPGQVLALLQNAKSKLPQDGRIHFTNFTGNMVLPNYTPGDSIAASWLDQNDVASLDIYWISRDIVCGGSVAGEIWRDGSGSAQPHGNGYNDLNFAECHRSSNYGYQVSEQRRLAAVSGKHEPIWTFVENGGPFTPPEVRMITPDEMAGGVFNSLIHEARGINYFNHTFNEGSCTSSNNLRDPIYYNRPCYTAIRAKTKEINSRIKQLAPVLNTQSYQHIFNPKLETMLKEHSGSYYIFAMPGPVKGGSATGAHNLQLPPGLNGGTAEVLFENRTISIGANRQFTDSFANHYTYHIYKITP